MGDDTTVPNQWQNHHRKADEAVVDERTGLCQGVEYSIDKGRRWELVPELKSADNALVLEYEDGSRAGGKNATAALKKEIGTAAWIEGLKPDDPFGYRKQEAGAAKVDVLGTEERMLVITRAGPEDKANISKKKKKKDKQRREAEQGKTHDRAASLYVVQHVPTREEALRSKELCREGAGAGGCHCNLCTGRDDPPSRNNVRNAALKSALCGGL